MPAINLREKRFLFSLLVFYSTLTLLLTPICGMVSEDNTDDLQNLQKTWHIYVVDEGGSSSIDVDSSCLPHIGYANVSKAILNYASWEHGAWSVDTVDDRRGAGHSSSLILDSADQPMIAHWDVSPHPDNGTLKMATWNGANWTLVAIDNETFGYHSIGLDLDSNEFPRISYVKVISQHEMDLWFAKQDSNGTWNLEMVDSGGYARFPSLHIDSDDHFHISYEDMSENELRYAYWNGINWSIERVDGEDPAGLWSVGSWSSIKVDRNGNPHIAYEGGKSRPLKYATKVSGQWQNTTIDYMLGSGLSVDLDSQMRPHISYQGTDRHLRHAWRNGSSWQIEIVDNSSHVGISSWLRIDRSDDIHISYSRMEPGNKTGFLVKYATTKPLPTGEIAMVLDIDPDTLNLKSKGKWITAYVTTENAKAEDIDASSLLLNDVISPEWWDIQSESVLMVKFDRSEVQMLLAPSEQVVLTITGSLYDGTAFEGSDVIRVIDSG